MRADEKVRELPAAGAGLGEQLRYRHLQQALGEQERRLERDACGGASGGWRGQLEIRALVQKPRRGTLKYRGQKLEQLHGGGALAALDHAQVGDRWCECGVALDATHRQFLDRQAVALAYRAQFGAEKMPLAQQLRHSLARPHVCACYVKLTV